MYSVSAVMRQTLAQSYRSCNSPTHIASSSAALSNAAVDTIDDIRHRNLLLLVENAGGQRQLADKIGKQPAQISQWVNKSINSRTGKPRKMLGETAREIEEKLELERGWMDRRNSSIPAYDAAKLRVEDERVPYNALALPLRPDQIAILQLWEALDSNGKRTVQEVGNAFAKQDLAPCKGSPDN